MIIIATVVLTRASIHVKLDNVFRQHRTEPLYISSFNLDHAGS